MRGPDDPWLRGRPRVNQFPVNLNLAGKPVLVVGAGRIALRKTEQLLACDANVTVLAPTVHEGFESLPVNVVRREYASNDVAGFRLVITATANRDVDQLIHDEAEALGIWVNSADDPDRCTFTLPATVRRGELLITISTAGASPALSSYLRARLGEIISPDFARVVDDLAQRRAGFHAQGRSTEDIDWRPIIEEVLASHGVDLPVAVTA
ncbi:MAG: bifunctional precorrin-2 dehydrogenase/sirohydrochlorin ferrochelatase [Acidimicrobiia bacterium]|nr:bifunctional precorrin-2 dehydrogenase/sirohydrochlorin ferrochelatase [Actinomycetota bacterium]NDA77130.1 bifunctional precorrin-2 dehydrogenase/sirohydrochlorin ferrochelatase [Actinomycetota bacterium]NDE58575.1 bifunctional precorrin-2 dehydrogenase/sirohydrochlorin ferrochelatase [Acidimicrobiia bacterium]